MKAKQLLENGAVRAWGYMMDGELADCARQERDKPRRTGKNRYNDALIAVGYRAVKVIILTEKDYQRLVRASQRTGVAHE